eukprot:3504090-Pleurochrysis_carterae.AAC.1
MDLQNVGLNSYDGVIVSPDSVEEIHSVRDDRLILLTLRSLLDQCKFRVAWRSHGGSRSAAV